jgi:hypothetical protein
MCPLQIENHGTAGLDLYSLRDRNWKDPTLPPMNGKVIVQDLGRYREV